MVHKGEVVWSQKDVARAGGVATVEAMRRGLAGYDRGGSPGLRMPAAPRMPSLKNVNTTNSNINAPVNINIDATGADAVGLARVQMELQKIKHELPSTVIKTIRDANSRGVKY